MYGPIMAWGALIGYRMTPMHFNESENKILYFIEYSFIRDLDLSGNHTIISV
jgi:hypothetical protein